MYNLYVILSTAYAKLLHMSDNSIVIVNPNSKGGQTGKNWDSIEQIIRKYFSNDLNPCSQRKQEMERYSLASI